MRRRQEGHIVGAAHPTSNKTPPIITTTTSPDQDETNKMPLPSNIPSSRMKPMSIFMGKEYDTIAAPGSPNNKERTLLPYWKTILTLALLVTALTGSWIIAGSHKAHVAYNTSSVCRSYNAAYFRQLQQEMEQQQQRQRERKIEEDEQDPLCVPDIIGRKNYNQHKCRCRNPFYPVSQDLQKVPDWNAIRQINLDAIAANYTSASASSSVARQPDVVIYGDSITERLTGNFFGKPRSPELPEYAENTQKLLTKQGGGKIDALPLGISSDQVSITAGEWTCIYSLWQLICSLLSLSTCTPCFVS